MRSQARLFWHRFSLIFTAMLIDGFQDCDSGFPIGYRVDGNLFNLNLQVKLKVQTDMLDELLYADTVKNILTGKKTQLIIDQISQDCDDGHLCNRTQKTEVLYSKHLWKPSEWLDKDCKFKLGTCFLFTVGGERNGPFGTLGCNWECDERLKYKL